jgi:tRNA nucleotidyltransferase/poly(A) polymerase
MKLLDQISLIAQQNGTSTPYICGGLPRDKVLGKASDFKDIDLTTGDETVHALANAVHNAIPGEFKIMDDKHATLVVDNIKIDFSSNFINPLAAQLLAKSGLNNPTKMQLELYSRDFTCNAMLMTMDFKVIKDPIGLGIKDIKAKKLRTCLPASVTLGIDNRRIVRAIYLASKLGFELDPEITTWVKQNPSVIANAGQGYIKRKLDDACDHNIGRTVQLITEMNLWAYIPVTEKLLPYMKGKI